MPIGGQMSESNTLNKIEYDQHEISNKINDLLYQDNEIWIASYDGLFVYNLFNKTTKKYSTQNGLRHNLIYCLSSLPDKTVIVGTKSNRLFFIKDNMVRHKCHRSDFFVVVRCPVVSRGQNLTHERRRDA